MRVVAGRYKGRRLVAPRGRGTRPTLEKVREAVFDMLGPSVAGARVLDLFAGSGSLGIEALSRGAGHVTWCDVEQRAIEAVIENIRRLDIRASSTRVMHMPAVKALQRLDGKGAVFDLVFVDPPYDSVLYDETLLALSLGGVVVGGGVVIVEYGRRIELSPAYGALVLERRRRYGDTRVALFENAAGVQKEAS